MPRSPADLLGTGSTSCTINLVNNSNGKSSSASAPTKCGNNSHSRKPHFGREISRNQLGVAFRRQVVIGNRYIVDFLAPSIKLAVEVDGLYHARRGVADARRERYLARLGYRVLRLDAELVLTRLAVAVELVSKAVGQHF